MVKIFTTSRYKINRKKLKKIAAQFLSKNGIDDAMLVNIIFVGKRKMKSIASKYKKEDVALPVLSFTFNEHTEENLLGEVFLCYPQVVLLAAERNKTVDKVMQDMIEHGLNNLLIG